MADKLYCSGCGKRSAEVENMIALASGFVCNECVELLYDIEQKRKTGDPVSIRNRTIKLEELKQLHADISRLREDVNRRLDWIESQLKLLNQGFEL
jgi:ClpX C4-type zinc finger